jgi:hypothetical protein
MVHQYDSKAKFKRLNLILNSQNLTLTYLRYYTIIINYFFKFVGNYIHEYDSKAKFKRLNFDLEFSKSDTNLLGTITY